MPSRIAFATCHQFSAGAADDAALIAELERRGHTVLQRVWNRDGFDDVDLILLRSCWDYHQDVTGFRSWLERIAASGTRVLNPATTALWNLDKSYLEQLAQRGVQIPTTAWIPRGSSTALADVLAQHGLDAAVVKPVVSMSGWETWRTGRVDAARDEARFRQLVEQRDVMVQTFASAVLEQGELSLVYFGGRFSHAIRKLPRHGEFRIHAEHGGNASPYQPPEAILAEAERIVRATPSWESLLYARVDLVPSTEGPLLMELELIDPELFFRFDPAAAARLVDALSAAGAVAPP